MTSSRRGLPRVVAAIAGTAIVAGGTAGCQLSASVTSVSPTITHSAAPSVAAQKLPNGVPMPDGALLVSGPTPAEPKGAVSGWSAVATQSASASPRDTRDWLRSQMALAGWKESQGGPGSPTTIAMHRTVVFGIERRSEWVQISVTEALINSGPALTYRFASAPGGGEVTPQATVGPSAPRSRAPEVG